MTLSKSSRDVFRTILRSHEDLIKGYSAFYRLAEDLHGRMTVDAICAKVANILREELYLENCSIWLVDCDANTLCMKGGASSPFSKREENGEKPEITFEIGKGIAGAAAELGRPVLVQDVEQDDRYLPIEGSVTIGSILSVPIFSGYDFLGIVNSSHTDKGAFNSSQVDLFTTIATVVSHMIVFASSEEKLEQRVRERTIELDAARSYLEEILNNANDMIITVTRDGLISYVNQRLVALGFSMSDLFRLPYTTFTGKPINRMLLRMVLKEGKAIWEVEIKDGSGSVRELSCSISVVRDKSMRSSYFLVVARDITEEKRVARNLNRMERLSSIGEMVAGITHELNNRLVPVLSYSELLMRRMNDPRGIKMLNAIYESAVGCKKIVKNMLHFSRQTNPEMIPFDLNSIITRTLELFAYCLASKGIEIKQELSSDALMVMADQHQLEQVFVNIINNAVYAMEDGGRLIISSLLSNGTASVSFSDTGSGIPDRYIDHVFDPFFSTKEVGKGTGLGLSVSYTIIKAHGGEISAASSEGKGTTFTVNLPLAGSSAKKTGRKHDIPTSVFGTKENQRVLVVDDDQLTNAAIKDMLQTEGFVVDSSMSADEAAKNIEMREYSVILLDMRMPKIDGRQFFGIVTKLFPHTRDRIIFITGDLVDSQFGELNKFINETGRPYISKPFSYEVLINTVNQVLCA